MKDLINYERFKTNYNWKKCPFIIALDKMLHISLRNWKITMSTNKTKFKFYNKLEATTAL